MAEKQPSKPTGKAPAKPQKAAAKPAPKPNPKAGGKTPAPVKGGKTPAPAKKARPRLKLPRLGKPLGAYMPRPIREGISLDRKLDILGIILVLVGLLTLLSFLSAVNSSLTGGWVTALGWGLGWGRYLFPLGLIAGGLWLVLRNFERIPPLALERVLGFALLFGVLLVGLHLVVGAATGQGAFDLAQAGEGGGYLGALASEGLRAVLGLGGAVIALLAVFVIALALALDTSVQVLLGWMPRGWERLRLAVLDQVDALRARRRQEDEPLVGVSSRLPPADPAAPAVPLPPAAALPNQVPGRPASRPIPWALPQIEEVLDQGGDVDYNDEIDLERARLIEETLLSFGAPAKVIEINRGPTITQFGVEPDYVDARGGKMRVRVGKIAALADDLALALSARTIRVQAPVPGKGFVGIEVPNDQVAMVALRDIIENEAFKRLKSPLRFALGLNVSGNAVAADLGAMPHLLVAGATGSGKSVCVNALICCLLVNNTPDDLRLVMVDPKRVELTGYNGIPHLMAPVVVELERVVAVLQWVTREMDIRYRKFAEAGCRNLAEFNTRVASRGESKLPHMVVIVDELADLMMLAPDETERTITRLAQLARATGIHLVIATQRPSVDVVTGLIKANFPARIAFAVASGVDSRVILDQPGAERLLGRGDMLFQAPDAPAPVRLQGVFVSDHEIQRLVGYWRLQAGQTQPAPTAAGGIPDALPSGVPLKQMPLWEEPGGEQEPGDPMLDEAVDLARRQGRASISMLQRRLRIGYTRAARLVETMEEKGIVGPPDPTTGVRDILDYGPAAPPADDD